MKRRILDSNFIVFALVWAKSVTQRPKGKRPDSSLAPFGGGRTINRQGLPEGYWKSALEWGILGPWPYAVSLPLFPATWRQAASSTTRLHFNAQAQSTKANQPWTENSKTVGKMSLFSTWFPQLFCYSNLQFLRRRGRRSQCL